MRGLLPTGNAAVQIPRSQDPVIALSERLACCWEPCERRLERALLPGL